MKKLILSGVLAVSFSSSLFAQGAPGEAVAEVAKLGPVEAMEKVQSDLLEGNLTEVWSAFPKSYQNDIQSGIQTFAKKVDPEVYGEAITTFTNLNAFLVNKKDLIAELNNKHSPQEAEKKEEFSNIMNSFNTLMGSLLKSDMKDLESLKTLDIPVLLKSIQADSQKLLQDSGDDSFFKQIKETSFKLIENNDPRALIQITQEGEDPTEEALVKIGQKWIPESMAQGWAEGINSMNKGIDSMEKLKPVQKQQILSVMQMAQAVIKELEAAKTADELEASLQQQMEQFGPMLMPLMMQMGQ